MNKSAAQYDYIVVGCGFSGTVMANKLADAGKKVLVIDKRSHIAGNMYDYIDKEGFLVHKYGPHILMINNETTYKYLSRFTKWINVETKLETFIDGKYLPLPINFNSILSLYGNKKGEVIIKKLLEKYKDKSEINILELIENNDLVIRSFAEDIYEKVFVGYNVKMWGKQPDEIDREVVGRSPIRLTYVDKKSKCLYEVVPEQGYSAMFKKMLVSDLITLKFNVDAKNLISLKDENIMIENEKYMGKVIYTGPIDELFKFKYGKLPYRALKFIKKLYRVDNYFNSTAVTFPQNYKKTRTTELKKITQQKMPGKTEVISEYSGEYDQGSKYFSNPSYPVLNEESKKIFLKYENESKKIENLIMVGRLAEYKYYNMEDTILSALRCFELLHI